MKVKWVETAKIQPYEKNPRRNKCAVDGVAASIKEFGFRQPLVVTSDLLVIVGHTRLLAAQKLGLDKVPVHIMDVTPAQVKAYRIADNRTGEEADWDGELLRLELEELQFEEYDLSLTGFNEQELEKALQFEIKRLELVESPPEKPKGKLKIAGIPDFQPMDILDLGPHNLTVGYEEPQLVKKIVQLVQSEFPKLKILVNGEALEA